MSADGRLRVEPTLARTRAEARDGRTAADLLELGMVLHRRLVEKGRYLRDQLNAEYGAGSAFDADTREVLIAYADVFDAQLLLMGEEPFEGAN